jgi:phosphoserine/homoserine phosphotransferase
MPNCRNHQVLITLDLEGTLIPDVWPIIAAKTGVEEFKITTREFPDFEELMAKRIEAMNKHGLKLKDIEDVCRQIPPLPGAKEFLEWLRARHNVIILSDIVFELGTLFMQQLGNPTLFCNWLEVDKDGVVQKCTMRQPNGKEHAVNAFHALKYKVVAAGDSYNDINMLKTADRGFFINAPSKIESEFPQFPLAKDFQHLTELMDKALQEIMDAM